MNHLNLLSFAVIGVVTESNLNSAPISPAANPAHIEAALDWLTGRFMMDLETSREPVAKELLLLTGIPGEDARRIRHALKFYVASIVQSPPSPGYEPLLIKRGENPVVARIKARTIIHEARRIAAETRRYRKVVDAIRFLAKPDRSGRAVVQKIALLAAASKETRIARTISTEAELSDFFLTKILPSAAQGDVYATRVILRIASEGARRIKISRGPKVTVASAAHELFLETQGNSRARAYTYSSLEGDFVDEATQATRLEFSDPRFRPKSASRRLKARRRLAAAGVAA